MLCQGRVTGPLERHEPSYLREAGLGMDEPPSASATNLRSAELFVPAGIELGP